MEKTRGYAVATCNKYGIPNVVPIHFVKVLLDDEIMFADIFMSKTFENIQQNPFMAVSMWDWDVSPEKAIRSKGPQGSKHQGIFTTWLLRLLRPKSLI